jgi:hypothetical protein
MIELTITVDPTDAEAFIVDYTNHGGTHTAGRIAAAIAQAWPNRRQLARPLKIGDSVLFGKLEGKVIGLHDQFVWVDHAIADERPLVYWITQLIHADGTPIEWDNQ